MHTIIGIFIIAIAKLLFFIFRGDILNLKNRNSLYKNKNFQ